MERQYDIFERLSDGTRVWRGHVPGLLQARKALQDLKKKTNHECFAMHLDTGEVVLRINVRNSKNRKPVVFQIAYDATRVHARTELLRRHGYEVISVVGNDAAKIVLSERQECDVFVLGHAAPERARREMVEWLKTNYPKVQILALNPPSMAELSGADLNLKINGPETLLPVIATALGAGWRESLQ